MWVALYINLHTVHEHYVCVGTAFFTLRWASAILISESKNYLKTNQVTSTLYLNKVFFFLSVTEAAKAILCTIERHHENWKQVCFQMTACFLTCMWGLSKILWNQGFPAFIEMINIQQSNYMLGTNDLLSTEHSPALQDFAEVSNTDLKRKKRKKNILSVVRK